jgi:glycosidase
MKMKNLIKSGIAALALILGVGNAAAEGLGSVRAASPVPEWLRSAVIYEANLRQGTPERNLKGLERQLPRLHDLGVDVIWLMPIHPISVKERKGTLGSYYAVQDYKKVNPEFGTMADLQQLVKAAHSFCMKVIIDEVCNHTGADNVWVTTHPEYYHLNENGEMHGIYDWTDVLKLDYSKKETRAAMIDALRFWIINADIDGYRCDVAGEVPTDFWEEARVALQSVKPIMMLAEAAKPELLKMAFDVDYAWPMKDVFDAIALSKGVNTWAVEKKLEKPQMNAQNIPALLAKQKEEYPAGAMHMNMVTNHDLNSWEGTEFDRYGDGMHAFAVLSYTLPGIPMMYTGQEIGFNHAFEFFEHDPVIPMPVHNEYTEFYKKLNLLKHKNHALDAYQPYNQTEFFETDNEDVLAFTRKTDTNQVTVIVNLSNEPVNVNWKGEKPNVEGTTDWFSTATGSLPDKLSAWEYRIFIQ